MPDFESAKLDWYKYNRCLSMTEINGGEAAGCAEEIKTFELKGLFNIFPPEEFFTKLKADAFKIRGRYWYGKDCDVEEKQFLADCLAFYGWANDFFGR